jgi:hypothetical protein
MGCFVFTAWAADTYTITATAGPGGEISPAGSITVDKGQNQAFAMDAYPGYGIENVVVDGKAMGPLPVYSFSNVNRDHTITVTFAPLYGTVVVDSVPPGASIFIDGTLNGKTVSGGAVRILNVPVGTHTLLLRLQGYLDYETSITVNEGQETVVPTVTLVPLPTTVPPTTTATTTVPTTTVPPTTTATTTVPTTTVPPTTTATTTVPTTTVPPTTTATTTVPTTTVTTVTAGTTSPVATASETPQAYENITPVGGQDGGPPQLPLPDPGSAVILAAVSIAAIVFSRDVLNSGRTRGVTAGRKAMALALCAIPCTALLAVLGWYLSSPAGRTPTAPGLEALTVTILIAFYLIVSSFALMLGAVLSWPLRATTRVHTVASILLIFAALFALINSGPGERFPLGLAVAAGLLMVLVARWQDPGVIRAPGVETGAPPAALDPALTTSQHGTSIFPPAGPDLFPGDLGGKYADIRFIGSGGLARVFRARNIMTGNEVALKIPIQADETTGKSFMKEILGWEALQHPNIVRIYEVNILPIPYVEMEFLPRTLADLPRPVDVKSAARIALGIARGLAFAHAKGIIHRDIKPQNILMTESGEPKITDWGMSKLMGVALMPTLNGFSLAYAAPEQVAPQTYGETDQRTDLYQLGTVLYEMVTGKVPFPGDDLIQVSTRIASDRPIPPSILNPLALPLDPVIMKCLEKDPRMRFQHADDLIRELETFLKPGENGYNIFED